MSPGDNWDWARLAWLCETNRAGLLTAKEYLAVLDEVINPPTKDTPQTPAVSAIKPNLGFDYQSIPMEVKNVHGVKISTGWDPRFPALKRVRKSKPVDGSCQSHCWGEKYPDSGPDFLCSFVVLLPPFARYKFDFLIVCFPISSIDFVFFYLSLPFSCYSSFPAYQWKKNPEKPTKKNFKLQIPQKKKCPKKNSAIWFFCIFFVLFCWNFDNICL